MANSASQRSRRTGDPEEEESSSVTVFDVFHGGMRERIVLQRLIVIAPLPQGPDDSTELGAHYEKLNFQLSKQHTLDQMTGLLLIYPSCVLHVVESSREVLLSVLKDLKDMQQQPDGALLEAPKVLFVAHNPQSRLFQQWSCKVLDADQVGDSGPSGREEEEESSESLVCRVLTALQRLGENLETSKETLPGSVLDETPDLIVSQDVLHKLLTREELLTAEQHLQMYDSPLHISMDFECVRPSLKLLGCD